MKEHFNSVNTANINRVTTFDINSNLRTPDRSLKPETPDISQLLLDEDQWSNPDLIPANLYNIDDVAGMDFEMAIDSVRYITGMSKNTDSRNQLSNAYLPVNPQKVIQLFGIS
jgi:hypothetical protein